MNDVKAWKEDVFIPTYEVGEPNKNPMFLEKRVYQGSSGVVYPHAVIDRVFDKKINKKYTALYLENKYLKIMILPELGGRIQMAYDKLNDYHFIYYNPVIKPALVGVTGPWISGGIEFNWPQHHRPSTFSPLEYKIEENRDGSITIWVSEIEIMFHTKGMAGFTLYPDKAYLEVNGKLYNRTPLPQTFLWWANPAVEVDEYYQSIFPPDVHAVYDHGKREVSSFPIATGSYYKVDYGPGTDISRYINIPVPTSYMAVDSSFDFVGGYHHRKKMGMLHVADHNISPGKKQWTWGAGDFGKAWDRQLTDPDEKGEYRPYVEIMTGVFTDNQPDFGWIMPNEERTFKQYFLSYKDIGYVKNANKDVAVNLEVDGENISVKIYVTSIQKGIRILLKNGNKSLLDRHLDMSPCQTFSIELKFDEKIEKNKLILEVRNSEGKKLIDFSPIETVVKEIPAPAKAINDPSAISSIEELYLAGLHLEQYRHASFNPVNYYKEALRRDPLDIRCNNALGRWYLKHGLFEVAEPYFRKAIERLTSHNPNPYNGEPYYNLGLSLMIQSRWEEAYTSFYKACWNAEWQDNAFFQLACISCQKDENEQALSHINISLSRNYHGIKARHLKSIILRKLGRLEDAWSWSKETLEIDKLDLGSRYELFLISRLNNKNQAASKKKKELQELIKRKAESYIEIAIDYSNAGCYDEAIDWLLQIADDNNPLIHYYLAYFYSRVGDVDAKTKHLEMGADCNPERIFPNRLKDIIILTFVILENPIDYKACYYLGNLWYDKRQYEKARNYWELSVSLNSEFPTAHRNLGIAYYNKFNEKEKATLAYEKAFSCSLTHNGGDSRVLFELDQLYKRENKQPEERLEFLEKYIQLIEERDDLYIEYVSLHNLLGKYKSALQLLKKRKFHPWEGGEGKVSGQYVFSNLALAKEAIANKKNDQAIQYLINAQHYPDNLGEGKLFLNKENDIFYLLGCAYQEKGWERKANDAWNKAILGVPEPDQVLYYNDQNPCMILYKGLALLKLHRKKEATECFKKLISYGQKHLNEAVRVDFFAVSLPELSVFERDYHQLNQIHCHYLIGLGYLGMRKKYEAKAQFAKVLNLDSNHEGAIFHKELEGKLSLIYP